MSIQALSFENQDVVVIVEDGEPLFRAKEVAAILGYDQTSNMLKLLVEDDRPKRMVANSTGISQEMTFLTEPGLYGAILSSTKEEAKAFKRWVFKDVLPAIRKTGGYGRPRIGVGLQYLKLAEEVAKVCRKVEKADRARGIAPEKTAEAVREQVERAGLDYPFSDEDIAALELPVRAAIVSLVGTSRITEKPYAVRYSAIKEFHDEFAKHGRALMRGVVETLIAKKQLHKDYVLFTRHMEVKERFGEQIARLQQRPSMPQLL
jgi:prophage antirepressor-like protein